MAWSRNISTACGCVGSNPMLVARWTGQDELTVENVDPGADTIIVTYSDGSTATIPLNDPSVSVVNGNYVITGWNTHNPNNLPIAGIDPQAGGAPIGPSYNWTEGGPIQPSDGFWQDLFPTYNSGNGYIPSGGNAVMGCWYLSMWYDCDEDRLSVAFNKKDLYGGDVYRTEIVTENGTMDVTVVDEWREVASAWTYGSGMSILDVSTLGLDWETIRTFDINDDLICEWHDPQLTWHGGPWLFSQDRCQPGPGSGGGASGPPAVNNVQVTP